MRSLDVIILKNAEAAGRESAHARNDGDIRKAGLIAEAEVGQDVKVQVVNAAWMRGYERGRQEG